MRPVKTRLDALTILRFAAALWVMALHLQSRAPLAVHPWWQRLCVNGGHAMTLFFVLSGTVLAYGYHRLQPKKEDVLAFYQARFARIYAPYAVLHLLALAWFAPANAREMSAALYTNVLSALGLPPSPLTLHHPRPVEHDEPAKARPVRDPAATGGAGPLPERRP